MLPIAVLPNIASYENAALRPTSSPTVYLGIASRGLDLAHFVFGFFPPISAVMVIAIAESWSTISFSVPHFPYLYFCQGDPQWIGHRKQKSSVESRLPQVGSFCGLALSLVYAENCMPESVLTEPIKVESEVSRAALLRLRKGLIPIGPHPMPGKVNPFAQKGSVPVRR